MKNWIVVAVLALASLSFGQELRIKGHVVGETTEQFLQSDAAISSKLSECHTIVPRAYTVDAKRCTDVVAIFDGHKSGTIEGDGLTDPNWDFEQGRMVAVTISTAGLYDDLRDDLARRLGEKPVETIVQEQSGFGATWTNRHAAWLTERYHAMLFEETGHKIAYPLIIAETRERYDAEQQSARNKPSPLD